MMRLTRKSPASEVGIVHLGPGAFFRAFGAVYTHEVADNDWGILAVSLRSASVRDALEPQGCAYTSVSLGSDAREFRQIESISACLVAPEDPRAVLGAMSDPSVRIVSLTITEKGYCHLGASGLLDFEHPDIVHDLKDRAAPRSAIGYIVRSLEIRKEAGVPPFTVLSCDNLPDNGTLVRGLVLEFARSLSDDLADWISLEGRFPSTMVDRITPAVTSSDVDQVAQDIGARDEACVLHEPFRQWVIEDDFVGGARPGWDGAGAQFVRDVAPFELMKLRCLNGTHSAIAYLGYLSGYETVFKAMSNPVIADFVEHLWDEIRPTVPSPEGEDLRTYCGSLRARYLNPSIEHKTWQIAMDGSQKLPQRLVGSLVDTLEAGRDGSGLILSIGAWMIYAGGTDLKGNPIDVRDPMAKRLKGASVDDMLSISEIFPVEFATGVVRDQIKGAYDQLLKVGPIQAMKGVI